MGTPQQFQTECRQVAAAMRRLPSALRREIGAEVQSEVAEPVAAAMRAAAGGPHANVIRGAVKTRISADPRIVIGGARPRISGGAGPRDLIYGNEFGGGKRVTRVPGRAGRSGYSRKSTNQFVPAHPFAFDTVSATASQWLPAWADVVTKHIQEAINNA